MQYPGKDVTMRASTRDLGSNCECALCVSACDAKHYFSGECPTGADVTQPPVGKHRPVIDGRTVEKDLVDAVGVKHVPADGSARIVSLVPSITELLFDLGLQDHVIGRTTFCVHPRDKVGAVRRVGGTKKVRVDRLRELEPSHVIVNIDENEKSVVEEMATFVPNLIVTHPIEPLDNLPLYRLLGTIFGRQHEAMQLCNAFERAYETLLQTATHLPARRVLYLIWRNPWMTVSPPTYISRMLSLVNWTTVGGDSSIRYPEVELSAELLADTDIVLFSSEPYPFKQKHIDEFLTVAPSAMQTLASIDGEMVSWYGSRAINGLQYLRTFASTLL